VRSTKNSTLLTDNGSLSDAGGKGCIIFQLGESLFHETKDFGSPCGSPRGGVSKTAEVQAAGKSLNRPAEILRSF